MKSMVTHTRQVASALVLAFTCTFLTVLPVRAQGADWAAEQTSVSPPALSFGLRVGITQTEFAGGAVGSADPGADLSGGAFLTYRLLPNLAVQPEVLFTRREGKVDHSSVFVGSRDVEYSLGFVDVPVLMKAYLPVQSGPAPYLVGGPYASMRLYANAEDQNWVVNDLDFDSELRSLDYGLTTGLGMGQARGRQAAFLEVRYNWGLTNLFREEARPDFRVRGLTFSAGFGF